jgi:undecaprenyl-diphosphatase
MEIHETVILGVLQGLTEFLPVSSSGHLVLGQIFFGVTDSTLAFNISVHLGTLAAIFWVYAKDILNMVRAVCRYAGAWITRKNPDLSRDPDGMLALYVVIGSVPTACIGLLIHRYEDLLFSSAQVVGALLLVTGTILWTSRRFYRDAASACPLNWQRALIIGVSQGLAVLPGISRSGTTIACAMFAGLDRNQAARFSFLLSIPAIIGAEFLTVMASSDKGSGLDTATFLGTAAAFVTGLVALKLLIRLVHTGRFHLFAPYCWAVGVLVLLSRL